MVFFFGSIKVRVDKSEKILNSAQKIFLNKIYPCTLFTILEIFGGDFGGYIRGKSFILVIL